MFDYDDILLEEEKNWKGGKANVYKGKRELVQSIKPEPKSLHGRLLLKWSNNRNTKKQSATNKKTNQVKTPCMSRTF